MPEPLTPAPGVPLVVSPDTRRAQRIPPGQHLTRKWPVLHAGTTPNYGDLSAWDFAVYPDPKQPAAARLTWPEFSALPRVQVYADMHCVTTWSKLDNLWEGIATREVVRHVTIPETARFVLVLCEQGFTTNLPLADFLAADCLFALRHNHQDLEPDHGYPVRLVIPRLYAWKSAKWVRGIAFLEHDMPGFWERWEHGGYHMRGDPWAVDENGDGQRFRKE
jgi:DMSO/TMAO reductase YedYZ molybdopterin-dependent catalytic subunit